MRAATKRALAACVMLVAIGSSVVATPPQPAGAHTAEVVAGTARAGVDADHLHIRACAFGAGLLAWYRSGSSTQYASSFADGCIDRYAVVFTRFQICSGGVCSAWRTA